MPLGSGRQKCSEWNEVDKLENDQSKVSCKHCSTLISAKVERVRAHLQKCHKKGRQSAKKPNNSDENLGVAGCSQSSMNFHHTQDLSSEEENQSFDSLVSSDRTGAPLTSTPKIKRQKKMDSFVVRTSAEVKDNLDLQVARFFFSANIPFSTFENKQFLKLTEMLRPGYQPPNRKKLAGELLDKVNEEVISSTKTEMEKDDRPLILMQDGWSNVKNDPIIAHSIHNGTKPHLLSITDPGANKKTAEYCASLAEEAIAHVKESFNKEVLI